MITSPPYPHSPSHPDISHTPSTKEIQKKFKLWSFLVTGKVLVISIALHLLGGVGATYWVVQTIQAKRKVTFQGPPSAPNPSTRALEHKVSMAKKQQTMSAPAQAKRIASTGLSAIALPEMPNMPTGTDIIPGKMAGMGGTGVGIGPAGGMGGGGGGGGGAGINFFGLKAKPKSIIFVVDISGSMLMGGKGRAGYQALEDEVVKALNALPIGTKFSIIMFSGKTYAFRSTMTPISATNKGDAIRYLKSYSPIKVLKKDEEPKGDIWKNREGGRHQGTSSKMALEEAMAMNPEIIMFVSDGGPTDAQPKEIFEMLQGLQANLPKKVVINGIAYKADGSGKSFMEKLASGNGGEFKDIK
jgi:hypothetical protein